MFDQGVACKEAPVFRTHQCLMGDCKASVFCASGTFSAMLAHLREYHAGMAELLTRESGRDDGKLFRADWAIFDGPDALGKAECAICANNPAHAARAVIEATYTVQRAHVQEFHPSDQWEKEADG